jgi:hypothetical protein
MNQEGGMALRTASDLSFRWRGRRPDRLITSKLTGSSGDAPATVTSNGTARRWTRARRGGVPGEFLKPT